MTRDTYLLHGLRVRSEIALQERLALGPTVDVNVRWGNRFAIPTGLPTGNLIARRDPDFGGCTIVETESGYTIRFSAECDFRISRDLRSITVDTVPDYECGFVQIVLTGNVLASVLNLQGACVLHASGVQLDGWTLAIVGASGSGKSTLAALFCVAGASLVSDDLLRVDDTNGGGMRCYTGTAQIRLRPKASALANPFPPEARETTADGRVALTPRQAKGPTTPLNALLVPRLSRRARALRVRRLPAKDALVELLRYPRVLGWESKEPIRSHFEVSAEIAARLPVFEATIPWGPPFPADLPSSLIQKLRG